MNFVVSLSRKMGKNRSRHVEDAVFMLGRDLPNYCLSMQVLLAQAGPVCKCRVVDNQRIKYSLLGYTQVVSDLLHMLSCDVCLCWCGMLRKTVKRQPLHWRQLPIAKPCSKPIQCKLSNECHSPSPIEIAFVFACFADSIHFLFKTVFT